MSTLIHVYNSEGTVGRCDAKCYDAECTQCDCICGGMNHAKGRKKAIEQTAELSRERVKEIERRGGYIADEVRQAVLL